MEKRSPTYVPLFVFLFAWLFCNMLQAYFMELGYDEAYYWTVSRFPDWGYYDHPPMFALLTAAGFSLFHNELGVRFFFVVTCTLLIYVLYRQTDRKDVTLFFMLIAGTTYFQIIGVGTLPSTPLLFFTALYFIVIREYIEHDNWKSIILLSFIIPLMFYSKYHAVLVILFTVLAAPSLLRRKSFWYIFLFSCILFSPHIYWQISHGFPTVRFHLQERYVDSYSAIVIPEFLAGQLLFAGPLMGFVTVPAMLKFKTKTVFEHILKLNVVGIFLFFLPFTLRGETKPGWTATAFIPLILLSYAYIVERPLWRRWVKILFVPSILIFLLLRIHIIHSIIPLRNDPANLVRGWKSFTNEVAERANGRPVLANTPEIASELSFYTGSVVPSLTGGSYGNQFDYWNLLDTLQGRDVFFLSNKNMGYAKTIVTPAGDTLFAKDIPHMRTYKKYTITSEHDTLTAHLSEKIPVALTINTANKAADNLPQVSYHIFRNDSLITWDGGRSLIMIDSMGNFTSTISIQAPSKTGKYEVEILLVSEGFAWWKNSQRHILIVSN